MCGPGAERYAVGDSVVAQPLFSCGNCEPCAKGEDNVCRSLRFLGVHVDGGFAQYVKVPTRKVYALPSGVDGRLAALAEPLAVAVHDVRRSGLQVGETVLIVVVGAIGLLLAIVARNAGAEKEVVSEISEFRRGLAESLGFQTANPLDDAFDARMNELSGGLGFNVMFEASGSRPGIAATTKYATITGTVMIIGMTKDPTPSTWRRCSPRNCGCRACASIRSTISWGR